MANRRDRPSTNLEKRKNAFECQELSDKNGEHSEHSDTVCLVFPPGVNRV